MSTSPSRIGLPVHLLPSLVAAPTDAAQVVYETVLRILRIVWLQQEVLVDIKLPGPEAVPSMSSVVQRAVTSSKRIANVNARPPLNAPPSCSVVISIEDI